MVVLSRSKSRLTHPRKEKVPIDESTKRYVFVPPLLCRSSSKTPNKEHEYTGTEIVFEALIQLIHISPFHYATLCVIIATGCVCVFTGVRQNGVPCIYAYTTLSSIRYIISRWIFGPGRKAWESRDPIKYTGVGKFRWKLQNGSPNDYLCRANYLSLSRSLALACRLAEVVEEKCDVGDAMRRARLN